MGNSLPPPPKLSKEEEMSVLNYDVTVLAITNYIKSGRAKNIVLLVGAGISVSAGIPDFRSPGTGLYDNLQKYSLPSPQSIFDITFFRQNPQPFCDLAREMYPGNFRPTPTHWFIRLLQDKRLLLRCYSQNIDTLEREAGIREDVLVEAHGSFATAHCIECGQAYSKDWVQTQLVDGKIPRCTQEGCFASCPDDTDCKEPPNDQFSLPQISVVSDSVALSGLVKPDIVFFGESLPKRFFELKKEDLPAADLLIVAGTSLAVHPFAGTYHEAGPLIPRLLINKELVGQRSSPGGHGFRFNCCDNYRDVAFLSDCDSAVFSLCDLLGWKQDLDNLVSPPAIKCAEKAHTSENSISHAPPRATTSEKRTAAQKKSLVHGTPNIKRKPIAPTKEQTKPKTSLLIKKHGNASAPSVPSPLKIEKSKNWLHHSWRTARPLLPRIQPICDSSVQESKGQDSQCTLVVPQKLEEIKGRTKLEIIITLNATMMSQRSEKDYVCLIPSGSNDPADQEDFAWVNFEQNNGEENDADEKLQFNQTETMLRVPYCTRDSSSDIQPCSYQIWYVLESGVVLARWGSFEITEDEEDSNKNYTSPLVEINNLLKSVKGTLENSVQLQNQLQNHLEQDKDEKATSEKV